MRTRRVECFRLWAVSGDTGTWDTAVIRVPADTPDAKLNEAVWAAGPALFRGDEVPVITGVYRTVEETVCRECGEPCFVKHESGTSHHSDDDNPDGIDYDADADHVAVPEDE